MEKKEKNLKNALTLTFSKFFILEVRNISNWREQARNDLQEFCLSYALFHVNKSKSNNR